MSEPIRNILIIIGIIILAGLGWFMYDQSRSLELRMTGGSGLDVQAETQVFIQQQRQLQQLNMQPTVLVESDFIGLGSVAAPIPVYPIGRQNPFSPSI